MKNMFLSFCCASLLLCSCGQRIARVGSVDVVPRPASVEASDGAFDLTRSTKICLLSDDSLLRRGADFFNGLVAASLGRPLAVEQASHPESNAINVSLGDMGPEAYTLAVDPEGIRITGGSPAGVYYAFQTLRQLLPVAVASGEKAGIIELPVVKIADQPYFAYRGGMLDVCRHYFPVEDVKTFIDILAMHKLNRFHWHLTNDHGWRIEIKKYPYLTSVGAFRSRCDLDPNAPDDERPYGGFYTQDEVRDIVQYAADRFITVIPEIEMPGHAMAALAAYPYLGCKGEGYVVPAVWGVKEDVFCAGKDSTFAFLQDVLDEVTGLFPSEYIHIGGDECPKVRWHDCKACQRRIRDQKLKNEFELQSYFVQRMEKYLNGHGRQIIGWDEILEGGLSKTATVMSWRGAAGGIEAAKSGNHVIMAPNTHCYLDYYPTDKLEGEPKGIGGLLPIEKVYSLDPYEGLNAAERQYILGVQGNLWTEFISTLDHAEYMLLPRLAAVSEVGWAYDRKDYPGFKKRMTSLRSLYDACGYNYGKHMFAADSTAAAPLAMR